MKKHLSTKRAARQNIKRREANRKIKEAIKKITKKVLQTKSPEDLKLAYSVIDKAKKRGVLHRNTAARKKSKLAKLVLSKK